MTKPIRVLLADDHQIMREGLRTLLEKQPGIEVIGEAADGRTAVRLASELAADVVVMDITMPDLNGIEATRMIIAEREGVPRRVIALSMHSNRRFMAEMLKAGASGYLLKEGTGQELVSAIRTVASGQTYLSPKVTESFVEDYVRHVPTDRSTAFASLTPREREVLQLVAEGKTTKEIAGCLHVSVKTIEAHRAQIMDKLQIHSIAGLTKFAVHEGLTSSEP
jgi:DNA-binding NarL/FixJ family response regulator